MRPLPLLVFPLVAAAIALHPRAAGLSPAGQVLVVGLTCSAMALYALLWQARQGERGVHAWVLSRVGPLLRFISRSVNRPMVMVLGRHHFFLSYGLLQGLGGALTVLSLEVFFSGSGVRLPVGTLIIAALVPIVGLNRLAGLMVQVLVEGLTLREALFKVRFLSVGFTVGMVLAIGAGAWWWKVPVSLLMDAVFVSILWSQVLGSLGCLFYGCCHGEVRQDGRGVTYAHPFLKPNRVLGAKAVCVTPTPIYCALVGVWILAFALPLRFMGSVPAGVLTALVGTCFGLARCAEEWFRYDAARSKGVLSLNQVYAVGLIALSLAVAALAPSAAAWHRQSMSDVLEVLTRPASWLLPAAVFGVVGAIYSYHRGAIGSWT